MVKFYSHSKLSTFEQCQQKYKYRYIDKIKVLGKSIEGVLGSVVHNVLEYLYQEVAKGRLPNVDEVITIYADTWKENYDENVLIVKNDMTEKDYFNKGVQFLMDYYMKNTPFDDNTLETEKKIIIDLDKIKGIKIIGYVDRLVHNKEKGRYEIHDYKTSNSLPTQDQVDNDRQLALYSIAIKEIYGYDKPVVLVWHYLAHSTKITSERTNEQLQELKTQILELIAKIESTSIYPYNKSVLCGWCEYKSMCPAWNSRPSSQTLLEL